MQELYKEQLEKQKNAIKKLDKKIEELQNSTSLKKQIEENLKQKILKKIYDKVVKYKRDKFKEVTKKLILANKEIFENKLSYDKKNIQNYLSLPLSLSMIEYIESNTKNSFSKETNDEFFRFKEDITQSQISRITKYTIDIFQDSYKDIFSKLRQKDQYTSAILFFIKSENIAKALFINILWLQQYENEKSDEFNQLSRQNRGDKIIDDIKNLLEEKKIETNFLDDKKEQLIAQELIDMLIEIGLVQEKKRENNDDLIKLETTDFFEEATQKLKKRFLELRVGYEPMIVPPLKWNDIDDGGFLKDKDSDKKFKLDIIKYNKYNRYEKKEYKALKGKIPKELLSAINSLQESAFKINKNMLDILLKIEKNLKLNKKGTKVDKRYYKKVEFWIKKIKLQKLNSKTAVKEFFERNSSYDKGEEKFALEALKLIAKENDSNYYNFLIENKLVKLQNSLSLLLEIAKEYAKYSEIFFVWQIDFRGRAYPVQTLLNPQGGDLAKSLLLFDKEQKLDKNGIKWFKIHGANLFGEVDKEVFEKRLEWIQDNEKNIIQSAKDPYNTTFWKKADEPFEFLAFCLEYEKYFNDPDNFYTSLPVAIDGSNNGLQHISTLLRDKKSAINVNVLPSDSIKDIYQIIADTVKTKIENLYSEFNESKTKSNFKKVGNYYYKVVTKKKKDIRSISNKLIQILQNIDESKLNQQHFTTYIKHNYEKELKDKDIKMEEIQKYLNQIESSIRKNKQLTNAHQIKNRIIKRLKNEFSELQMDVEDGLVDKDYYKYEEKDEIVVASLFKELMENIDISDRKFVKKAVMTDSYGSSTKGKAKSIYEDIKDKIELNIDDSKKQWKLLNDLSKEIAKIIEESITKNSQASYEYEKFIKKVAKEIVKTNNHIFFKTPIGFLVKQLEFESQKKDINIGKNQKIRINIYNNDKIDKNEHKKGLLPNFIHSLDATHLFLTINRAKKDGLTHFITVHDSFATYPNDMEKLSIILREEFIKLHSKNILSDFLKDISNRYHLELNLDIPIIDNDFDINQIIESKYFFA